MGWPGHAVNSCQLIASRLITPFQLFAMVATSNLTSHLDLNASGVHNYLHGLVACVWILVFPSRMRVFGHIDISSEYCNE